MKAYIDSLKEVFHYNFVALSHPKCGILGEEVREAIGAW